jgi:hypothetical protein
MRTGRQWGIRRSCNSEGLKMRQRYRFLPVIVAMTITNLFWLGGTGECFNNKAHRLLSSLSVDPTITNSSILDKLLRTNLGFEFWLGIDEPLQGGQDGTVVGQIQVGSTQEDHGFRPLRHFHNPRLSWDQAGLNPFQSSIRWSQNPNQFSFDKRSWHDARNLYFQALTATTDSEAIVRGNFPNFGTSHSPGSRRRGPFPYAQ